MGGYGSSRTSWIHAKATTDGHLRLDVRQLVRMGFLAAKPGERLTGSLFWSRRGERIGEIGVDSDGSDPDRVTLEYQTRPPGGTWQKVQECIELEWTDCHYGGTRPWFLCPGCGSRRAVLYSVGGRFRCRLCHDLVYGSQREDRLSRHRRRAETLRDRLGNESTGPSLRPLPTKSKGMHWRTYDRLQDQILWYEQVVEGELAAQFVAFMARAERLLQQYEK